MSPVRPFLALAVLALAAGCMGSTVIPVIPQESPAPRFLPAMAMPAPDGKPAPGFEPSVAVDGNGVVYLTAAQGVRLADPEASWLWVSDDGGRTFRVVPASGGSGRSNLPVGFEGHVDATADGKAYFVDLTLASITVARSADGGKTWDLRTPAAALVGGGDREWVAAGPGDDVYVGWNQLPSGYWIMGSKDGGRTFPVQTPLPGTGAASPAGPGWSYAAVPAVAPDGKVHVARAEDDGVAVYTSADGARTFTRVVAWPAEGEVGWLFSTATVDAAGTLYVSTVEELDQGTRVRYAYSKDGGATFSPPREVSSAPGVHAMQWGAAGPQGHFAVAFYENPAGSGVPDVSEGEWFVRVAWSTDADTPDPTFREARPADRVVHEGTVCTGGLGNCEGNSRDLGDYLGVDVGPDGAVHVTWIESTDPASPVFYARTG